MVNKQKEKKKKDPINFLFAGIILIILLFFIFPNFNLIKFPYNLIGIIFLIMGVWLILLVWKMFKKNSTPESFEKSRVLVTTGPFKFSRNPMYIGKILFLIGLCILLGNVLSFISPLLFFIIMDRFFIPFEEHKTEKDLGKKYLSYKRKVRRWI